MIRLLIMAVTLLSLPCHAQTRQELAPGQPFPYKNALLKEGGSGQKLRIGDFKGKYLLLDLFGSICVQSFKNLPLLDSLDKKHADKLNVLMIGKKDAKIQRMYSQYKSRYRLELDVCIDSSLFKAIKLQFLPTYVWIDPAGIIVAISAPDRLTAKNIDLFISGQSLPFSALPPKSNADSLPFLLAKGNAAAALHSLLRCDIVPWNSTHPRIPLKELTIAPGTTTLLSSGSSMEHLYRLAFFGRSYWSYGDSLNGKAWLHLITRDSLYGQPDDKFILTLSLNSTYYPDISAVLKSALQQYFGYAGVVVHQPMPYYRVTVNPSKNEALKTTGDQRISHTNPTQVKFRNVPFDELLEALAYYNYGPSEIPFVDESGIDFNIDLSLDCILTSTEDFFAALNEKGIQVELKYRTMDVLQLKKVDKMNR